MKTLKDLGENVAIQCKTQEEWDYLVETYGISRVRSRPDLKVHLLDPNSGTYTLDYVKRNGYTIHQASDFMPTPQDEIKELKARIATLEESLRPKKKIEFVRLLHSENMTAVHGGISPERYDSIEVLFSYPNYDVMKATHSNTNDSFIYLGHFNDGEK